ncbi:MAG: aminotransferase class V-fold PLP-dependent enzyme, partial [Ardenticatenales bacterium]|nr:aminotransferase class V-fold PLP-dependent enzyme [Ardenticatenales bacterium]
MIPGPIEFEPDVLDAMAIKTESHVDPAFIARFGDCLRAMRELFQAPEGQPFVIAGSGTLAMEIATANLVEPGDGVLLVNSGYFSDRFATLLTRYGATVEQVRAPIGHAPAADEVAAALDQGSFKALVATHVDTSTGVRVDVEPLARLARERGVLSIFDGVCATGGERFEQSRWEADLYLTASQKAIGVPPGLA